MLEHLGDLMNKLVIAPHADDETLGCGGILDSDTFVYICSIDESMFPVARPTFQERFAEVKAAAEYSGYSYYINPHTRVNYLEITRMVEYLEMVINQQKPESIFIPHPGYNQDHQVVYKAARIALRPHDSNFFIKRILVYEAVHDFIWSEETFIPNYFIPIDIDKKLEAFSCYKSQVKSYRSLETITQIAALRGSQSNVPYAESFEVLRWVE